MTSLSAPDSTQIPGAASPRIALANAALERAWVRGWASRPSLDPAALLAAARKDTGLADFGSEDGWRERLERLTASLEAEADLTALGITIAFGQLVAALSSRLRATRLWRDRPEIAQVPLTSPIVVLGQMRSGTTRMQRLLASDPQFAHTRFFESWNPLKRWPALPVDDRRLRGWTALRVAHWLNPAFGSIHPSRSAQADEEMGLHNIALYGSAYEAQWRVPAFARYAETLDAVPIYVEFRRYLQTIRWLRGDRGDKPWILKLPQFTQDLAAVLDVFPDARLIVLHRDPVKVVGSSASLVWNQMSVQSDSAERDWIGREWLRKTGLRQRRMTEVRSYRSPAAIDVTFASVEADWRAEVQRVYRFLGQPFLPQAEARMARFMNSRRHGRLAGHRYDIADFGFSAERIHAELGTGERLAGIAA